MFEFRKHDLVNINSQKPLKLLYIDDEIKMYHKVIGRITTVEERSITLDISPNESLYTNIYKTVQKQVDSYKSENISFRLGYPYLVIRTIEELTRKVNIGDDIILETLYIASVSNNSTVIIFLVSNEIYINRYTTESLTSLFLLENVPTLDAQNIAKYLIEEGYDTVKILSDITYDELCKLFINVGRGHLKKISKIFNMWVSEQLTSTSERFYKAWKRLTPYAKRITEDTARKIDYLFPETDFFSLNKERLSFMYNSANTYLMSRTRKSIKTRELYSIDGQITTTEKSSIYYAFKLSTPYCIKVSNKMFLQDELEVYQKVKGCDTLVPILDSFEIHGDIIAVVMPVYPRTVNDLMDAWCSSIETNNYDSRSPVPEAAVVNIFYCLTSSLSHLERLGHCHSDISPNNIFLDSNGYAILGDYGAMVEYGEEIKEYTERYCLDAPNKINVGCLKFDLICVATLLVEMSTGKRKKRKRTIDLKDKIDSLTDNEDTHIGIYFARFCLENDNMNMIIDLSKEITRKYGLENYIPNITN